MAHEKFTEMELEKQNSDIMSRFNFEKVHKHMVENEHQWYMGSAGMRVPDLEDLRWAARDLLTKAAYSKDNVTNVGTGGFMAYKMPWGMSLTFQIVWG
jgi:hypothetical protein